MYTSELFFFFPGFLWFSIRRTLLQRVVDILRTLPLVTLLVVWSTTGEVSRLFLMVCLLLALILNIVAIVLDKAIGPYKFDTTVYAVSQISVVNWLFCRAASSIWLRCLMGAINVAAGIYFSFALLVAFPISQAYMCYPSRDPSTFKYGYCPQYTGDYTRIEALSPCSIRVDQQTLEPRCDPALYGEFTSMHDAVSNAGHVAGLLLSMSAIVHCSQIGPATERARVAECLQKLQ